VLAVSGVRGTVAARVQAGEAWGWQTARVPGAAFHAVTAGTAWLRVAGRPAVQLMPGDVVLLPTGIEHVLASDADNAVPGYDAAAEARYQRAGGIVALGSGPVRTHVLCAHYRHDPAVSTQVLGSLPEVVHIRADNGGTCLDDTVRLLAREVAHPQIATTVVLDRLVDILLVQLLRVWLAGAPPRETRGTWLGALGDPIVIGALDRLHGEPARAWTTAMLAAELAVSRSTLSRRFVDVVGQAPTAYLTRWRMDLAALRLRDTDDPLEVVARAVGYRSVYAFSRAFSRARAEPPGRYRQSARARAAA
jgi:AraC-like DNA-binding protein